MQAELLSNGGLVVSVVSHGHGLAVRALLQDLARLCARSVTRVVVTLNQPREESPISDAERWPFSVDMRRNCAPRGFGTNHNQALQGAAESFVCVLNPDVRLVGSSDPFAALLAVARRPGVGCAYPQQVDEGGRLQDSERALPTPAALLRRRLLGLGDARVDWVNAACLVLPRQAWEAVGGFDERYHMYCEDVDLSLRLRLAGWALARAPTRVLHVGQRASRRHPQHLWWHLRSMVRLWASPAYWRARTLLPLQPHAADTIGAP
ncbi:glycosyltransferase [Melaminivora suipulveris]|uniref:glycosyltransferase n=1 Tax=Melaminivora suipulveris TaxID=2109913 RepID=UPI0018F8A417|nr:glycosyltransferase [Melaminivora suipulveris]